MEDLRRSEFEIYKSFFFSSMKIIPLQKHDACDDAHNFPLDVFLSMDILITMSVLIIALKRPTEN